MNFQTSINLQFRQLLIIFLHGIHIDLRDTSGDKIPFVFVGSTRLLLMFRKSSNFHFYSKTRLKTAASGKVEIPYYKGFSWQWGREFGDFALDIGRKSILFHVNVWSQLQNIRVLTWWNLLRQKLHRLWLFKKNSRTRHTEKKGLMSQPQRRLLYSFELPNVQSLGPCYYFTSNWDSYAQ